MSRATIPLCAFVLVLIASGSRIPARTLEGAVLAYAPEHSLTIVNQQTAPTGIEFILRGTLIGPSDTLTAGDRVRVCYRMVGERRPITERVRVLAN